MYADKYAATEMTPQVVVMATSQCVPTMTSLLRTASWTDKARFARELAVMADCRKGRLTLQAISSDRQNRFDVSSFAGKVTCQHFFAGLSPGKVTSEFSSGGPRLCSTSRERRTVGQNVRFLDESLSGCLWQAFFKHHNYLLSELFLRYQNRLIFIKIITIQMSDVFETEYFLHV